MSKEKSVLIVTDGNDEVKKMAEDIAAVLKGNKILIKDGEAFAGTDILSAEVLFLGCAEPSPLSFGYFEELLQHINLVDRSLGVFSPNSEKAAEYLTRITRDCEVNLEQKPFIGKNSGDIQKWTAKVLAGGK